MVYGDQRPLVHGGSGRIEWRGGTVTRRRHWQDTTPVPLTPGVRKAVGMPPGYFVSRDGVIFSMHRRHMLPMKPTVDRDGYLRVCAKAPSTIKSPYYPYRVHRVVCETFNGPPFPRAVVRHLDGKKQHNDPANLAWGTPRENEQDAKRHGTRKQVGETHFMAILSTDQVLEIRRRLANRERASALATEYGVCVSTICYIGSRRIWRHV